MADIIEYKCPHCGGTLEFNAEVQKMKCPFCDSIFEMAELQALDDTAEMEADPQNLTDESFDVGQTDANVETSGNEWAEGESDNMRVYSCRSCGAEIIADATTGASNCPYCNNVVVMKGQFAGDLRPDILIPFRFTKDQALEKYKTHINSRRFVPKAFSAKGHPEEIKGVYVPFWLFDADANADIHYNATRVRSWSDSNYNYTETKFFQIHRAGSLRLSKVPVDGSKKMPDVIMESVEPFRVEQAVPFTTAYLAGYMADRYDVDYSQCTDRANERMRASCVQAFRGTVKGYTTVTEGSSNIAWNKGKVTYALYPVWMLATQFNGKNYLFAMNGQTGKFIGDLPLDKKAYSLARIKLALAMTLPFAALVAIFLAM